MKVERHDNWEVTVECIGFPGDDVMVTVESGDDLPAPAVSVGTMQFGAWNETPPFFDFSFQSWTGPDDDSTLDVVDWLYTYAP